ncbi:hypothetical protein [Serinibacter arcticus]|uniref:hypothetical protein n=1 Tax=Serinibacter arcticus TaxID=1655435 RepID=UPI0010929295|nr:hypothetical protein [Serinibacter arcticus]
MTNYKRPLIVVSVVSVVLLLVLSGLLYLAQYQRPNLQPQPEGLPPCTSGAPVPVADLAGLDFATCTMDGQLVQFPDGYTRQVPSYGVRSEERGGDGSLSYELANSGAAGVVAVLWDNENGGTYTFWGPRDAVIEHVQLTLNERGGRGCGVFTRSCN